MIHSEGAGVPLDSIRLGLRTFQTDEKMTPGRFNVFNVGRARVVIDYGHNPHALRAIQAAVEQMRAALEPYGYAHAR